MEVVMSAVADSARESRNGKLTIRGIFDTIYVKDFPALHRRLVFVFRLRSDPDDRSREHELEVGLIDPTGRRVWGAGARVDTLPGAEPGQFGHANSILEIRRIRFTREGAYRFEVLLGGKKHVTVFQVLRHPR